MSAPAVVVRVVAGLLLFATTALADPAAQSSLPWLLQGDGPVARAGRLLFFAGTYAAAPRANQAQGIAVFSQSEAVAEVIDLASGSDVFNATPDGAGGWYAGGPFSSFGSLPRRGLVHLLANGKVDPAFVADLNLGLVGSFYVSHLALNGAQLIVAGSFTTVNLTPRAGLAWLDATTGQVLGIAPAVVADALVLSGNTLFVVGTSVRALNASTGAFLPGFTATVFNAGGRASVVAIDGTSLFIAGGFSMVNGVARVGLAKLDTATGFVDPVWQPAVQFGGFGGAVRSLAAGGGLVYIAGVFDAVSGNPRASIAAVSTSTGAVAPWRADASSTVEGITLQGGVLYLAGNFASVGGVPRSGSAAVSASGAGVVLPWDPSIIGFPRNVAVGAGKVALLGSFNNWGVRTLSRLSAVDVVSGELLAWAPNLSTAQVFELLGDGSRLIVAGSFSSLAGESRASLGAFDLETRALLPFAPVVNGSVHALAVANGVLYIGGAFTSVNSAFRLNLAAIDLQSGQLLPWDPQADGIVRDLVVQDGTVIVAGDFISLIGTNGFHERTSVGAITVAGAVTTFDAHVTSGAVYAVATSGSTLFMGGLFATVGGFSRPFAAGVNVVTGGILPWNPAPNGLVQQFSVNRSLVYMRGTFSAVGGVSRTRLARVNTTDGTLSPWQLAFAASVVSGIAAADDGLQLNGVAVSSLSSSRDNGMFLPEESLAGAPGPPTEPAARVVGSTLTVTFGPPVIGPRPSSYVLEAGSGPSLSNIGTIPLATNAFSFNGVPPGLYYARVRAVGPGGVGAASREFVFAAGASSCTSAPTAPPMPTTTVAGDSVLINWRSSPGSAPSTYTLFAGSSAGLANIATLPLGSGTSFTTGGVPAGVYFVRVVASNACGQSPPSADGLLRVGGAAGPPGTPVQLAGTAAAGGAVSISWLTSTGGGAPTAHVLEAGSGPTLRNIAVVPVGAGTGLATAGVPTGTYYIRVRALNAAGISTPSEELILVVP
jgi:hypothetical protein